MTPTVQDMQRRLALEAALPSRIAYTILLVMAGGASALTIALWLTEPSLPLRTQAAFGLLAVVTAAWAAFAGWVLARRRVLFARHRVVASRLAVVITLLFVAGAVAVQPIIGWGGVVTAAVMLAVAFANMVRASQALRRLEARRAELERELGLQ